MTTTLIPDTYAASVPWETRGVCRDLDPDLFDLPGGNGGTVDETRHREQIREAKRACAACPVKEECLAAALRVPPALDRWAIAGETTPAERRSIRRQLRNIGHPAADDCGEDS